MKVDGAEADRAEADGVDEPSIGTGITDSAEADGANEPGTGIGDGANKPGIGIGDGADEPGTGKGDGADEPDIGQAAEDPRRRPAERQVAARASLFFLCRVACFFFFSLELETSGSSVIS